ncbi:hypothetical protein QBC42DRAFT_326720 [Cladorrhinum samala]|uniref:Clr5 domain-containing protein n=1 Tax=Cladorrhinum samala TaxID=585594 RepID=A0AAV9HSF5_9PEZI|nr:hypothetical protein QBC42DRAFT_326720 [Cladorrhinum samala]
MKEGSKLDHHYDEIRELYFVQGKTLDEVMKHMSSKRNLSCGIATYKRKLKDWGLSKNRKRGAVTKTRVDRVGTSLADRSRMQNPGGGLSLPLPCPSTVRLNRLSRSIVQDTSQLAPQISTFPEPSAHPSPIESTVRRILIEPPVALAEESRACLIRPWNSSWLSFMSVVDQLCLPREPGPTAIRLRSAASVLDLAPALSPSAFPFGVAETPHEDPNLSLQISSREKGKHWWTVKRIGTVMPENPQGHPLFLPGNLSVARAEGFSARSIAQLFHLANNFTFWEIYLQEPYHGRTISQIIHEYDSDVLGLVRDIEASKAQNIKAILFHGGHPTIDAVKEKIFATALRTGNLQLVKLLLSTGSGIQIDTVLDDIDGEKATPVEVAASIKDEKASLEMVSLLLRHKARLDANCSSHFKRRNLSPAFRAAGLGHLAVVRTLLSAGSTACIETRRLAVEHGDELLELVFSSLTSSDFDSWVVNSMISYLRGWKSYYPDLKSPSPIQLTAIGLAALKGNLTTVKTLARMGCNIHATQILPCGAIEGFDTEFSSHFATSTTAIAPAILGGHHDIVRFLLNNGVLVNCEEHFSPLLTACYRSRSDILMTLINAGADVRAADLCGMSFMSRSLYEKRKSCSTLLGLMVVGWAAHGQLDLQTCEYLISRGARVDHALFEATRLRNMPFVSLLLNTAAPSFAEEFAQAALVCAINTGFLEAAQEFFEKGAVLSNPATIQKIETQEMFAFLAETDWLDGILRASGPAILTSIILAGNREYGLQVLRRCVALGLSLDFTKSTKFRIKHTTATIRDCDCTNPLDAAILANNADLMSSLLVNGASWSKDTLAYAVLSEQPLDLLHVLVSSPPSEMQRVGGKIDISKFRSNGVSERDEKGCGIAIAAKSGNRPIIKLLLDGFYWGAKNLGIALTAAVASAVEWDVVQMLLDAEASLDQADDGCHFSWSIRHYLPNSSKSPIHAAISRENQEAVKMLIGAGADPNQGRDIKITPLQLACELGNLKMVDVLLDVGADINAAAAADFGATALQYASIGGHLKLAARLLDAGAHINANRAERWGTTAIQGAAEFGRLEMMHLLLRWNPKVHGRYRGEYIRAVKLAEQNGHMAVSRVLKSYGRWKAQWDGWYNATMLTRGGRYEVRAAFEVSEDEHELYEPPTERYPLPQDPRKVSGKDHDGLVHDGAQEHVSNETTGKSIGPEASMEARVSEICGSPSDVLAGIEGYMHDVPERDGEAGRGEQDQMDFGSVNELEGYDMVDSMAGSGNLVDLLEQWLDM